MISRIFIVLILFVSWGSHANIPSVPFTTSNVVTGNTPDTITFQLDSCNDCISGMSQYIFSINHISMTGGSKGSSSLKITNDNQSCIIIDDSKSAITDQFIAPEYDSYLNGCSTEDAFTTHIVVNNLPIPNGWAGGALPCSLMIDGNGPFDCSVNVPALTPPSPPPQVITDLTNQYKNVVSECGSENSPDFLCSGVLIRATVASADYHSWDPSPASITSGGVSFSYLRKDAKFNSLAYGYTNGFIIYPGNDAPSGKIALSVLCSFPIDADTDNRSDAGCGEYQSNTASRACQIQGIFTAQAWAQHYSDNGSSHSLQCGFGLDSRYTNIADAFSQTLQSMSLISTESFSQQNELRIATWESGIPTQLPLQAFFYLNGSAAGLQGAQHDQSDYYTQTAGMVLPIVRVTLPQSSAQDVTFTYSASDQVVSEIHKGTLNSKH